MTSLHPNKNEAGISVIILAGGLSSRMGRDKGLILLQGRSMIEHILEQAAYLTTNIIIVTGNPAYKKLGFPCQHDIIPGKGPLGGIYTGLIHSSTRKNIVLGCDTPFISDGTLQHLAASCGGEDVLITEHRRKAQPLCAVYDKNCIAHFKDKIAAGQLKLLDAIQDLKVTVTRFDEALWLSHDEFANINTPEELNKFESQNK